MTITQRFARYLRVLCSLDRLQVCNSVEEAVEIAYSWGDGFLEPLQFREEILPLLKKLEELQPRFVLEIGTAAGGTLYMWTRIAAPNAVLISIDLPGGPFGGGYSPLRIPVYKHMARPGQRIHLLRGDSHERENLERVRHILGGRELDYLFIDGDHSYEGARQDWDMYSPLVRSGGIVAFHDVMTDYHSPRWGHVNVRKVWNEIKRGYQHTEYVKGPDSPYGIGALQLP